MSDSETTPHPPRVMGLADVVLFYVVTGISLRWIATAAAAGPSSLLVWLGAFLLFYIPLALAVLELSSRHPDEGGLYVWARHSFGDLSGFLAGWCYWTSNLPYFPAVFYFAASNAIYIGGRDWLWLNDQPAYFMWFSFIGLALISWLNISGLKHARWLHNAGAYGMWIPVAALVVLGLVMRARYGSATEVSASTLVPSFELKDMLFWASLAFAFSGCETASFMSGEIKEPRRTIPRALIISGATIAACYMLGTLAVMWVLPTGEINSLSGLLQATSAAATRLGLLWLVPVIAFLITIGNLGAAGGFLAATSRIPFVAGIDRTLPPAFGKLHPRYGTPYVAIIAQTALGALFLFLGQAGTNVKGAYDVLVSMGIITAFVPFLFVFLSLIAVQKEPAGGDVMRVPGGRAAAIAVGIVGLLVTLCAIGLAMLPAADEHNKPLAVIKIVGLTAILIGVGWAVFTSSRRGVAGDPA